MTETTTTEPQADPDQDVRPADMLLILIVTLLAPMFLLTSGGDIAFARLAAIETVSAYRARSHCDLIAIAQIVGCGLVALGSLGLSMADDLSLSMTLRLRGNATALNRTVEHARRALAQSRPDAETGDMVPIDTEYEATVLANVAETRKRVAAANARSQAPQPPAPPPTVAIPTAAIPPVATPTVATPAVATPAAATPTAAAPIAAPATGIPDLTDAQKQALWAAAMSDEAAGMTANLAHLPPSERKQASLRAAALSTVANQLLTGQVPPRPRPGDLAALMQRLG